MNLAAQEDGLYHTAMQRNDIDVQYFKSKLEAEQKKLEGELATVGRINPDNASDWQPTPAALDTIASDENEMADSIEEYEEHSAVLKDLEIQLNDVKRALKKIEDGNYGICEISGEPIEKERLEANPAARTTIAHKDAELS